MRGTMKQSPISTQCALTFLAAAFICAALSGCSHFSPAKPAVRPAPTSSDETYEQMERLAEVMLLVKKNYVEDKNFTNMINGALAGMLQSFDEHSYYMAPEQVKDLEEDTSAHYGGVGLYLGQRDGQLVVISPIEDTPAYRAGLLAQDTILKIDDTAISGLSLRDAVKRMRGELGSKLRLTILRRNETDPRTVEMTRESINVPTVKGTRILQDGIGYVRITQFSEPTASSLQQALEKLYANGLRALVLDLRSNPGGLLKSAKQVAELFLKNGSLIVSIRDRSGKANEKQFLAEGKHHYADIFMAILIDGGSASASEIVAGALQDQKRAILVGSTSFGKGSVQTVIPLGSDPGAAIRLTTSKYFTPSERVIHKHGIEPDIRVPVTTEEWRKIQIRRAQMEQPDNFTNEEKQQYLDTRDLPLERATDLLQALCIMSAKRKTQREDKPAATNSISRTESETDDQEQ